MNFQETSSSPKLSDNLDEVDDLEVLCDSLKSTSTKDLYSILNISSSCSKDELVGSFKRLCLLYHPDKHIGSKNKEEATKIFNEIQFAYNVLKDDVKRALYDELGMEGISENWHLGKRFNTKKQMREEYEKYNTTKIEKSIEQLVPFRNQVSLGLDISKTRTEAVKNMRLKNEYKLYDKEGNNISLGAECSVIGKNKTGQCEISVASQHNITANKLGVGVSVGLMGQRIKSNINYVLNKYSYMNVQADVDNKHNTLAYNLLCAHQLNKSTRENDGGVVMGYIGINIANSLRNEPTNRMNKTQSILSIGRINELNRTSIEVQLYGPRLIGISYTSSENRLKIGNIINKKVVYQAGLSPHIGLNLQIFLNSKINKTKIQSGVEISQTLGICVRLTIEKLNQSLAIPVSILQKDEINFSYNFKKIIVSLGAASALALIIQTAIQYIKNKKIKEIKKQLSILNEEEEAEKAKGAAERLRFISHTVLAKKQRERERNGLVIEHALYGNTKTLDVTVQLQNLVSDSKLYIPKSLNKNNLIGFYDPCPEEAHKHFIIHYSFNNKNHMVKFDSKEEIVIPSETHLCS